MLSLHVSSCGNVISGIPDRDDVSTQRLATLADNTHAGKSGGTFNRANSRGLLSRLFLDVSGTRAICQFETHVERARRIRAGVVLRTQS